MTTRGVVALALAVTILFSACPGQGASLRGGWAMRSVPGAMVEILLPRYQSYRPLSPGDSIPEGALVRYRPDGVAADASAAVLIDGPEVVALEMHRGAVLRRGKGEWVPLLGRFKVTMVPPTASGTPSPASDDSSLFRARFPRGRFELQIGEALFEIDGRGNGAVVLQKGQGWVKTDNRAIIRLEPGQQLDLPRWGSFGRLRNPDARWAERSRGFLTSAAVRPIPPMNLDETGRRDDEGIEVFPDMGTDGSPENDLIPGQESSLPASDTELEPPAVLDLPEPPDGPQDPAQEWEPASATLLPSDPTERRPASSPAVP